MKHFLARLVERVRGTAPRVEPIMAPRFAPASPFEIAVEEESGERQDEPRSTPIEIVRETLLVPQFQEKAPSLTVRQEHFEAEAEPSEIGAVVRAKSDMSKPESPRPKRATPESVQAHARVAKPQLSPLRDELRAHAPIVRVTIGRIEVRSASPPAPMPRKSAPRTGPKLTLDAYLKARKKGAR